MTKPFSKRDTLTRYAAKSSWQPIETVPFSDDGEATPVLLYHPTTEYVSMTTSNPVYAYLTASAHGYTHWMPLPEPPKAQ